MRNRHETLLWMRDLIEHLSTCQEQLQWAAGGPAEAFLTEAMIADLSECQKLCEHIRHSQAKAGLLVSR